MPSKVSVDKDLCIACGLCVGTAPSIFSFGDDGKAEGVDDEAAAEEAINNCPVAAIKGE